MKLKGKVAVVTGAASGIGCATAVLFAREGAKVAVVDRNRRGGEETVKIIRDDGGEACFVEADVSKAADAERMVKTAVENYGRLDTLYNNAGISLVKPTHETAEQEWDKVIDVNLKGVFLGSKYAIPQMIKQGGGVIINTASIWSHVAFPNWSAYCASKGGVLMLTKAMAVEYAPYNIRVNCVSPGTIDTELTKGAVASAEDPEKMRQTLTSLHPLGRIGSPEEVAHAVLFLASDESSFITGTDLSVDGGRRAKD